jgi:hypothetical protein
MNRLRSPDRPSRCEAQLRARIAELEARLAAAEAELRSFSPSGELARERIQRRARSTKTMTRSR